MSKSKKKPQETDLQEYIREGLQAETSLFDVAFPEVPARFLTRSYPHLLAEFGQPWRLGRATPGRPNACFANAMTCALQHEDLRYVEGYAILWSVGLYVHHGWCVDRAGRVVDVTWPRLGGAYFGIPFRREYVEARRRAQESLEHHGSLLWPDDLDVSLLVEPADVWLDPLRPKARARKTKKCACRPASAA
jgi:hypothetical protein